ncbi:hypothetical protein PK35_02280 [Tamlana nanhaiensis]|uniref:Polysaccharide pyruvyl transferase domain-containing protein n=1 Tax=Neotamlana nanhaiensis TaxID=1382798 RepID=A0A0D7W654_9FLAO|nr:polysaccharide pyruvyl transferase family protein [Tamlana nanhaiensis]KJD34626.1 hypothetical protein PK35_02280 [Tamlana nanhaiensis]
MNSETKVKELKKIITDVLTPIINNDYVYLDLPYHNNIGDTLIWKGTETFLQTIPHKCLYKASCENYITPKINESVIILLHGGGNFGDLYEIHNNFRLKIIKEFPNNPIIILPQTIYYKDKSKLESHSQTLANHKNLTICARDHRSLNILRDNFEQNKHLLLPDMAFCIDLSFIEKYKLTETKKYLYFKRSDKEFRDIEFSNYFKLSESHDAQDWPTYEVELKEYRNFLRLLNLKNKVSNIEFMNKIICKIMDLYILNVFFPKILKLGIEFISTYEHIYSTRLHAAILSILLDKKITFLDNSYGKNSNYYKSWLYNLDSIEMISN